MDKDYVYLLKCNGLPEVAEYVQSLRSRLEVAEDEYNKLADTIKDYQDACSQKQEALDATQCLYEEFYDKCKVLEAENERLRTEVEVLHTFLEGRS